MAAAHTAFFNPWEPPPPFTPAPEDQGLCQRIATLAKYALQNGPSFIEIVRSKQIDNAEYAFLSPGGDGYQYFRWHLYCSLHGLPMDQPLGVQEAAASALPEPAAAGPPVAAVLPPADAATLEAADAAGLSAEVAQGFLPVLDALSGSKESIKQSSGWFMQCAHCADGLAYMMARRAMEAPELDRKMHVLYLANDVLFRSLAARPPGAAPGGDGVAAAFAPLMGAVLSAVFTASGRADETKERLAKILGFWLERGVFGADDVSMMQSLMEAPDPQAVWTKAREAALARRPPKPELKQEPEQEQAAATASPYPVSQPQHLLLSPHLQPPHLQPPHLLPSASHPAAPGYAAPWPQQQPLPGAWPVQPQSLPHLGYPGAQPAYHPHMAPPPPPHPGAWAAPPHPSPALGAPYAPWPPSPYPGAPAPAPAPAYEAPWQEPAPPEVEAPEPVSSFNFPPGLIPELVRDKNSHSANYTPISVEDIEDAGLPAPPDVDSYLRSRLEAFHAEVRGYRPGTLRGDVEEARQRAAAAGAAMSAVLGAPPEYGVLRRGKLESLAAAGGIVDPTTGMLADGSFAGRGSSGRRRGGGAKREAASMYVGLGAAPGVGVPGEKRGGQGRGRGAAAAAAAAVVDSSDPYSSYRHTRSSTYHTFIATQMATRIPGAK